MKFIQSLNILADVGTADTWSMVQSLASLKMSRRRKRQQTVDLRPCLEGRPQVKTAAKCNPSDEDDGGNPLAVSIAHTGAGAGDAKHHRW